MSAKEQLIESARRVMFENGYSRTRISDIVKDAGLAQGTFYLYFKNKESILEELISVIEFEQARLLSEIDMNKDISSKDGFFKELYSLSDSFRQFYSANSDILKIITEELPHSSLVRFYSDKFRKNARDIVSSYLKTGYKLGALEKMDFDIVADIISISLKQIILDGASDKLEYSVDEMFNAFIQLCMFGAVKKD
ncbi:MAG: TetR/AcrR family transcriptional regulator [Caldisericia bacterium]